MGLLGGFLNRLLGRGPGAEGDHDGSGAGRDEPGPHSDPMDRLSRIAQRGRGDVAARPSYSPPQTDHASPIDSVPPPGAGDAPEPWDAPAPQPYGEPEPQPYEASVPYSEPQPDLMAGGAAANHAAPAETFQEDTPSAFAPPAEEPAPMPFVEDEAFSPPPMMEEPQAPFAEEQEAEEPGAFAPSAFDEPAMPAAEEEPADVAPSYPEEPTAPFAEDDTLGADAEEQPYELRTEATDEPALLSEEEPFDAGQPPFEEQGAFAGDELGPQQPDIAAPLPFADEPPVPQDFMPAMPGEAEGEFALATKLPNKRRSGLGLSPMEPGDEVAESIEPGDRTAIVFRQIFPPPHDGRLSFFGGAPIASPAFAWPRPEGGGAPFSFLMQVDCAEVPAHARMGLPERGILYVFLDLSWGQQDAFRVMHEDAADGELMEIAPPDDLPPAFGDEATHVWEWTRRAEDLPRLLPKWPFQPAAIDIPADAWEVDEEDEDSLYLWPGGALVNELLLAAQGEEVPSNYFTMNDFIAEDGSLVRPFAEFPHDARSVQIVTGLLLKQLERKTFSTQARELADLSEEEQAALFERIRAEAQEWYDDAAVEAPFGPVPQEVADQFWTWLEGFPWLTRFAIKEAMILSIEASLTASPEAAARIPPEVARRVRSRHALVVTTDTGFHVNIPDRMLAPPVDVQGHQAERARSHILLLEISSNEGLGHHFGEGVCQFWITPEDLKTGRFDRVELTADAY